MISKIKDLYITLVYYTYKRPIFNIDKSKKVLLYLLSKSNI